VSHKLNGFLYHRRLAPMTLETKRLSVRTTRRSLIVRLSLPSHKFSLKILNELGMSASLATSGQARRSLIVRPHLPSHKASLRFLKTRKLDSS
jgi:hypothetical protein